MATLHTGGIVLKATGIVRRIDELGRVVIPKEIRRTLRIHEGSPLEIFTDHDGGIILKKYSPVSELASFASEFTGALHQMFSMNAVICDKDTVVACAGSGRREYGEQRISDEVERAIAARGVIVQSASEGRVMPVVEKASRVPQSLLLVPIVAQGDAIGAVILFSIEGRTMPIGEPEIKTCQTVAAFLGRQMEA